MWYANVPSDTCTEQKFKNEHCGVILQYSEAGSRGRPESPRRFAGHAHYHIQCPTPDVVSNEAEDEVVL